MSAPDRVWTEVNALPVWKAPASHVVRTEPIPILTERPMRLKMLGPCKTCGEKRFVCDCDMEGDAE